MEGDPGNGTLRTVVLRKTGTQASPRSGEKLSPWVTGFSVFAGMMLVAIGAFHFMMGLAAVLDDTFFVVKDGFAYKLDVTTWGWIHMIGGIVVGLAGIGVFTRSLWARIVGMVVAVASIVWSFYSIPYYPVWSIR